MRPLTHADYLAMRRFPALDGLRAISALMVVACHYGGDSWTWLSGWSGLHVFFVLSGFLITTLLLREEEKYGGVSLRDFYIRRAFRIMPAYYVALFLPLVLWGWSETYKPMDVSAVLGFDLVFLNEFQYGVVDWWHPAPLTAMGHTWTIAVEQKFYLIWPLLAFTAAALVRRRLLLTVVLTLVLLAGRIFLPANDVGHIDGCYAALIGGCLLAVVLHSPRGFAALGWLTRAPVVAAIVVGFLAVQLALKPVVDSDHEGVAIVVYIGAVLLLVLAVLGVNPVSRLLSIRPLVFIGERSYSLYLLQVLAAIIAVAILPPGWPDGTRKLALTCVIALLMADLLYRGVELPMIKLGRQLTRRHKQATQDDRDLPAARPDDEPSVPQGADVPPPRELDPAR